MADVVLLPNANPDILEAVQNPEIARILDGAKDSNLKEVALVGRDGQGSLVVFGSTGDPDKMIGLFTRGIHFFSSSECLAPIAEEEFTG